MPELNIDREHDENPHTHGIRFYGVVTLGNLIMVAAALLPVLIWGVRLESRVDTEALLRGQLEKQIVQRQVDDEKRNTRIETLLDKINSDVTALRIRLGATQRTETQP